MDALADLVEISTQVEAALVLDKSGELLGSTFKDDARAREVARLADDLLSAAREARGAEQALVQVQAATQEGSVFVVREQGRVVAATTTASPAAGLVFHDLRTCLRTLSAEAAKPKRKRPARAKAAGKSGDAPT